MMFIRSAINFDTEENSTSTALVTTEPSLAKQSFKDECDINTIVRKFGITGELPQGVVLPSFADYDGIFDYQTAMNALVQAQEDFLALPSEVRDRFNHDPQRFLEFFANEENRDEARRLGLLVPEPPAAEPATAAPPPELGTPST